MIVKSVARRMGYHVVTVDSVDAGVRGAMGGGRHKSKLMSLGGVWVIHGLDEQAKTIALSGGEGIEIGETLEWIG